MKLSCLSLTLVMLAGCSTTVNEDESFPLSYVEGRVSDTIYLTAFADGPNPTSFESIGIVIERPEAYRGRTVVFNFKNKADSDYVMLSASRDSMIYVSAEDGRGYWSGETITFTSKHRPIFRTQPNKAPEPTP